MELKFLIHIGPRVGGNIIIQIIDLLDMHLVVLMNLELYLLFLVVIIETIVTEVILLDRMVDIYKHEVIKLMELVAWLLLLVEHKVGHLMQINGLLMLMEIITLVLVLCGRCSRFFISINLVILQKEIQKIQQFLVIVGDIEHINQLMDTGGIGLD